MRFPQENQLALEKKGMLALEIKKPIIIIGSGRCGSSLFYTLLCQYQRSSWPNRFSCYFPRHLFWTRFFRRLAGTPVIGNVVRTRITGAEAYALWDSCYGGFSSAFRDLESSDVTTLAKQKIRASFAELVTERHDRLILKITGWGRIGFLKEVFPDAKFIHFVRDGRMVADSLMNVHFWGGWSGPQNWRLGNLPDKYQEIWEKHGKSFIALAGIYWNIAVDSILDGSRKYQPEMLTLKYEDFCANPVGVFRQVFEFAEMEWEPAFERRIRAAKIRDNSQKWRKNLTEAQQNELTEVVQENMDRLGYKMS